MDSVPPAPTRGRAASAPNWPRLRCRLKRFTRDAGTFSAGISSAAPLMTLWCGRERQWLLHLLRGEERNARRTPCLVHPKRHRVISDGPSSSGSGSTMAGSEKCGALAPVARWPQLAAHVEDPGDGSHSSQPRWTPDLRSSGRADAVLYCTCSLSCSRNRATCVPCDCNGAR